MECCAMINVRTQPSWHIQNKLASKMYHLKNYHFRSFLQYHVAVDTLAFWKSRSQLLSCVGEIVFLQGIWPRESFNTLCARKLFLSCMRELVSLQSTWLRESLVATCAAKLLLSCVGELVSIQGTWLRESLVALGADKLLPSCVGDLVYI